MIELNGTFLIQIVNFFVMVLFLNYFLFKPVMEMVEKRNKALKSLHTDAAKASNEADQTVKQLEERAAEAKKAMSSSIASARQQAILEQESIMKDARRRYAETLDAALEKVGAEMAAARKQLKGESENISREMAKRILGREAR